MNRFFGTAQQQPVEAKPQQAPPQQQAQPQLTQQAPKTDLYAQQQKVKFFSNNIFFIILTFSFLN